VPFAELAPDGRFLPSEELRRRLETPGEAVAYCGSGVSACMLILAAEAAGLTPPRLYPGSWSEWSRRGLPVEVG
jgi:thiosulfate/3-mercaptopyruvate sulfurtransferase